MSAADSYQGLEDLLQKCIHCGLCLPVCPTYAITAREESSPRGRIRWMKSVHDGILPLNQAFAEEMYFCLDCQACVSACPAGVRYGELVEHAREDIHAVSGEPARMRWIQRIILSVVGSRRLTLLVARLLRVYQRSGLREAIERSLILTVVSRNLHEKHTLLPVVDAQPFDEQQDRPVRAVGQSRGRVAFLSGCIMNVAFGSVHEAAVRVLRKCGFDVIIPEHGGCCGSLHAHNGDSGNAERLARESIDQFERLSCDWIVVDSAGCGAFMKQYGEYLREDPTYALRALQFSAKVVDFSEFLAGHGPIPFARPLNVRATYHDACHLAHGQKVSQEPRSIIKSVPGLDYVELPEASWCCGSAGIYNIIQAEHSARFQERKVAAISGCEVDYVVTSNPGCHLQIDAGLQKFGITAKVISFAEFIDKVT